MTHFGISLHVDVAPLLALATKLKGAAKKIDRAIDQGLNEGGDKVRTDVRKALQTTMGVRRYGVIVKGTRSFMVRSTGQTSSLHVGGMHQYMIVGSGKGLPIKEFTTKGTLGAGGGVTSNPWATLHKFKRSFVGTGRFAGQFRARLPGGRVEKWVPGGMYGVHKIKINPTRALYGASIPQEMLKRPIGSLFVISTGSHVPPAIIKRVSRALIG